MTNPSDLLCTSCVLNFGNQRFLISYVDPQGKKFALSKADWKSISDDVVQPTLKYLSDKGSDKVSELSIDPATKEVSYQESSLSKRVTIPKDDAPYQAIAEKTKTIFWKISPTRSSEERTFVCEALPSTPTLPSGQKAPSQASPSRIEGPHTVQDIAKSFRNTTGDLAQEDLIFALHALRYKALQKKPQIPLAFFTPKNVAQGEEYCLTPETLQDTAVALQAFAAACQQQPSSICAIPVATGGHFFLCCIDYTKPTPEYIFFDSQHNAETLDPTDTRWQTAQKIFNACSGTDSTHVKFNKVSHQVALNCGVHVLDILERRIGNNGALEASVASSMDWDDILDAAPTPQSMTDYRTHWAADIERFQSDIQPSTDRALVLAEPTLFTLATIMVAKTDSLTKHPQFHLTREDCLTLATKEPANSYIVHLRKDDKENAQSLTSDLHRRTNLPGLDENPCYFQEVTVSRKGLQDSYDAIDPPATITLGTSVLPDSFTEPTDQEALKKLIYDQLLTAAAQNPKKDTLILAFDSLSAAEEGALAAAYRAVIQKYFPNSFKNIYFSCSANHYSINSSQKLEQGVAVHNLFQRTLTTDPYFV